MSLVEVHRQRSPCQQQVRETMLQDLVHSSWDIQSQPRFRARLSLTQPTKDLLIFLTCEVEIMKFTEAAVGKVSIEKKHSANRKSKECTRIRVCVYVDPGRGCVRHKRLKHLLLCFPGENWEAHSNSSPLAEKKALWSKHVLGK